MLTTLVASAFLAQKYSIPPVYDPRQQSQNVYVEAETGRVKFAEGDVVQLIGIADLARPELGVWSANGTPLESGQKTLFWSALKLSDEEREAYSKDEAGRTFCLVFKLFGAKKALNLRIEENRAYSPLIAEQRTIDGNLYETRIVGPIADDKFINISLETPGGAWQTLLQFSLSEETTERGIEIIKRFQHEAHFVTINGKEEVVRRRVHYFTVSLPPEKRGTDLEIVSNDPAEDSALLGGAEPVHILGEDQGQEFVGKDLFIVPCVNKLNFDRVFTLRWRPKRIAVFKDLPLKR